MEVAENSFLRANARDHADRERIAVDLASVATANCYLWSRVDQRSDHRHGLVLLDSSSFAEVGQLQYPIIREEHVFGLQVTVDYAALKLALVLVVVPVVVDEESQL